MKKILSIVAVLALVLALAAPAFAAEAKESPVADDLELKIVESSEKPETPAGYKLLGVWDASLVHKGSGAPATAEETTEWLKSHDVDFSSVLSQTPDMVQHKVDGSWKQETLSGKTVKGLTSLSPFAFFVKDAAAGGAAPAAPGKKSPQTGYNTALWAISAAAMTLAAGYCFSRKKVAE